MRNKLLWLATGIVIATFFLYTDANSMGARRPADEERTIEVEVIGPNVETTTPEEKAVSESGVTQAPAQDISKEQKAISAGPLSLEGTARTKAIQQALLNAGFDPGAADGKMGPRTKRAIKEFQKANDLAVDGKIGPKTWSKLKMYLPESSDK